MATAPSAFDTLRRATLKFMTHWHGAFDDVPGVLLGAGPSLARSIDALSSPLREGWAVALASPSLAAALVHRGVPSLQVPLVPDAPWSVAALLALRATGVRTIVLAGIDLCFLDGLSCAADHAIHREWASEINPFRTIENLHTMAVSHSAVAAMSGAVDGAAPPSSGALEAERAALSALINEERAAGITIIDLAASPSEREQSLQSLISSLLPRRQSVPIEALRERGPVPVHTSVSASSTRHASSASSVEQLTAARPTTARVSSASLTLEVSSPMRIAAVVACDPERGGTGVPRHLDSEFAGRTILAATLERLSQVRGIERIILLVPSVFDARALFDERTIAVPVDIEPCGETPFPEQQDVIRTARLWSDSSWRGGINGASVWDEIVAPEATLAALERHGLDGALLCGADWPLLMVEGLGGADELVERFRLARGSLDLVFAPGPPGLGGCVIGRPLLASLAARSGPSLIGERLDRFACTADDPSAAPPIDRIRQSMVRAIFDSMRAKLRLRRAIEPILVDGTTGQTLQTLGGWAVVEALEHQFFHLPPAFVAQHLIVELNTGRRASGSFSPHRSGSIQRAPMTERLLERILEELEAPRDVVITFGHVGDPLWHPHLPRFIQLARDAGARAIHVRTELLADDARIDAMLAASPDVISVDLHAMTPSTYQSIMGINRFDLALANVQRLLAARGGGDPRFRRPLVVPRLQRRDVSAHEVHAFLSHWRDRAGAAVIEGIPVFLESPESEPDRLIPAEPPAESIRREGARRMVILSDGRVPMCELDLVGEQTIGSVMRSGVFDLWRDLLGRRRLRGRESSRLHPDLRWWQP